MNLEGKKVVFFGDSITAGSAASEPCRVFHQVIKKDLGLKEALNFGIGGTRIAPQIVPNNEIYDQDFNGRVAGLPVDAEAVFVFGGTNDYGHGDAPFGKEDDKTEGTFCGAVYSLFNKLISKYGKEKIVVMTPLHRRNDESPLGEGARVGGAPLKEFAAVIKSEAEKLGLKVIDLFNEPKLNPNDDELNKKYFADGLHPNDEGHTLLAKIIEEKLNNL